MRAVRRNLRHDRELPRAPWSLTGYWLERGRSGGPLRHGRAADGTIWVRGEAEGRDEEDIMDEYERALDEAGL